MQLDKFKALVDATTAPDRTQTHCNETERRAQIEEIRGCFTAPEGDQAGSFVCTIINDLGLRYCCERLPCEPYLGVARALQQALRQGGDSKAHTSDWQRAVQLARTHDAMYPLRMPGDNQWESNVKVCSLSAAVIGLRAKGYQIDLPSNGGLYVSPHTLGKLEADITSMAESLGRSLATSAAFSISKYYSTMLGRYNLGRPGKTVEVDAKPELPLAYLYQLGLRYFNLTCSAKVPIDTLQELYDLVTLATGLLDLTSGLNDLLFAYSTDVIGILQRSAVYDSVFLVTQAKPAHAREYLSWMLTNKALANRKDKLGRTTAEIRGVALMLLDEAERSDPKDFISIDPARVANALRMRNTRAVRSLLADVFAHKNGANKKLTFPPKDTDVDSAFRPLLPILDTFAMQPGPMAARAVVNAALDWCKKEAWPDKRFDELALGPLFEQFIREKLAAKGVVVRCGSYSHGGADGQCDAVVETQTAIIFLELKSKMLTREARAGNDIKALEDLSQALIRPQAQAMERHAVLVENGTLTLTSDGATENINLNNREVLKISVTRGEMGSLHDRVFIGQFMRLGCVSSFHSENPENKKRLDEIHLQFKKLCSSANRAKDDYLNSNFPFSRSWSFSFYHLLMLLERTTDSESFSRELQRTRQVVTNQRDFFTEYAFVLDLEKHRSVAPVLQDV